VSLAVRPFTSPVTETSLWLVTGLVAMVKVTLVPPAGTVTLAGTVAMSVFVVDNAIS
jgi:hypothetical protein